MAFARSESTPSEKQLAQSSVDHGKTDFNPISALRTIGSDAIHRIAIVVARPSTALFQAISFIPLATAAYAPLQTAPLTQYFKPIPTSVMTPDEAQEIEYSVGNENGWFDLQNWAQRGQLIRQGGNDIYCLGNLSWALSNLGSINAGEYSGAAGTLALLPTAGALIGAPTKELWLIFKLMPVAGILTMFLSLRGTIMPSQAGDYEIEGLNFGGMIASDRILRKKVRAEAEADLHQLDSHERLARRVTKRAAEDAGSGFTRVWIATFGQLVFLGAILIVLWYGQLGAVIPWWCRVWGWMYFWLFLVIIVSLFENWSSSPFSKSWTMRVSRAPKNIEIGNEAPRIVAQRGDTEAQNQQPESQHTDPLRGPPSDILKTLKHGIDSESRIIVFQGDPYTRPRSCFYVVVSREGVTKIHAAMKILSKTSSLAVYAFGTALFAAAQLMSISVALMILSIVIGCASFARFNGMLIAAEMFKNTEPIIHAVVKSDEEAAKHVEAVLSEPGLVVEIMGHVIVEGRVVTRNNALFNWATYIGLLAPPFDLQRIGVPSQDPMSRRSTWNNGILGNNESNTHVTHHPK